MLSNFPKKTLVIVIKICILRDYLLLAKRQETFCKQNLTGERFVKTELLDAVESKSLKENIPHFEIGDTVEVRCKIREGKKERIQLFSGTVIARKGRGINETFTVRRMVGSEGVERIFPLHSPNVAGVKAIRSGKAKRAKLYYLRDRVGKAVRLSQRHSKHTSA